MLYSPDIHIRLSIRYYKHEKINHMDFGRDCYSCGLINGADHE